MDDDKGSHLMSDVLYVDNGRIQECVFYDWKHAPDSRHNEYPDFIILIGRDICYYVADSGPMRCHASLNLFLHHKLHYIFQIWVIMSWVSKTGCAVKRNDGNNGVLSE
jgi:hypothetical protein